MEYKDGVSHLKTQGTSNSGSTLMLSRYGVSCLKTQGTSNKNKIKSK